MESAQVTKSQCPAADRVLSLVFELPLSRRTGRIPPHLDNVVIRPPKLADSCPMVKVQESIGLCRIARTVEVVLVCSGEDKP
jgi:hypothetical protein